MANGYLGKISAIVTANTGDFKPKLDAAASDVQKFARTVQSNLTSASSSASKAFEGIHTPLQKLERGLQAAASMKLSFKGFEGALKDVDALKSRLASLGKRQIDISVTGTGFQKVSELRDAIAKITSKDVKIVAGFGGLDQARQLLAAMNATGSKGSTFWMNGDQAVKIRQGNLAEVIAKFEKLQSLGQIEAAIKVVGEQGLQEALLRMRQMHSAAEALARPLAEAAKISEGMGFAIQAGMGPALKAAQAQVESVKQTITNGMAVAEDRFSSVGRQVRLLVADMKQLAEAQNLVSGMKTGRELAFANPRLAAQLSQAAALANKAAEMPEAFLSGSPAVAGLVQQLNAVSQKAADAYAAVRGATSGKDAAAASAELSKMQAVLDGIIARLSKQLPLDVDTTPAVAKVDQLTLKLQALQEAAQQALSGGKPQTMTQATSEFSRIIGQFEKLSDAQRNALGPGVNAFLSEFKGGEANLANILAALDKLDAETKKQLQINIDTAAATSRVDKLKDALQNAAGAITPNRTPMEQLRRDAEEAKAAVDKVKDATTKATLEARLTGVSSRLTALADPTNPAVAGMSDAEIERMIRREQARLRTTAAMAGAVPPPPTSASDIFGASLGSSAARVTGLESQIKSLQSSISQLPIPLQSKLIPALEKARNSFAALGKNPTAAELARAAQNAENLERQLKRVQAAAQFRGTFRSFLNDNAANTFLLQLNAVRQGMASIGATASGPVAQAINRYQRALYEAANAGRLSTNDTKKQMDELLQKIAQVAVATKQMTAKEAQAFVQMVQRSGKGDISRMGLGNFNLAMQQAAFAIDDFMSSTGGIEFKLRAISNNLTQMAFILGGTRGLWIGLGAVMAATIGIPLAKAIFDFDQFENQNKALNDELEKSKNIAERTAEAYKELGKALRESGMGGGAAKVATFAEERRKAAKDAAESAVMQRSPAFAAAQSRVLSLEKALESETDIGRRGQLLRQLDEAKRQREAVRSRGIAPSSLPEVAASLDAARQQEIALRRSSRSNWEMTDRASARRAREAGRETTPDLKTPEEAIRALDRQISQLGDALSTSNFFERLRADYVPEMSSEARGVTQIRRTREQIAKLEEERARLQEDINLRRNERFMPRAMAAAAGAELTPAARDRVARLGLGSNVTAKFESQIEGVSKEFADIITELEKRTRAGEDTTALEKAADDAAKALEFLYQQADKLARDVALGAIVPTKERLDRAAEQLAGVGPSAVSTDIARAQAMRDRVEEQRNRAEVRGDQMGVDRADYELGAIDRLAAKLETAAVAVAAFQKAMDDAALALSKTLVQEAQNRESELRRTANRFSGNAMFGDAAAEAAAEADRQEDRDRELRKRTNQERLAFEAEIAGDIAAGRDTEARRLSETVRDGRRRAEDKTLTAAEQEAGRLAAEEAQARLDRMLEARPGVAAARAEADGADETAAKERDRIAIENEQRQRRMGGLERQRDSAVSMATEFGPRTLSNALGMNAELESLRREFEAAVAAGIDTAPIEEAMDRLKERLDGLTAGLLDSIVDLRKTRSYSVEGQLDAARQNLQGVGISDLQGKMTEIEVRRRDLERRRDEALAEKTPEGDKRAVELQAEIDAQRELAAEVLASAVALGAFQEAVNKVAMALQNTLAGEAAGRADSARRAENEAVAIFGERSPEARRARDQRERAEEAMRDAEDEKRRAEEAITNERVKFEQEMAAGQNPAAAARAERIADLEKKAADERLTAGERAAAKAEADRLRDEQEREFESRPEVQAERRRADEADQEMARRQSVERGLELGRTEEDRRREGVRRQAGDLKNAADFLRDAGRGREIRDLARNAAINMARDAAPLYAQLTQEVMTARLQGPSRAALNVSDVNTTQGASELNRLLRGDDSARDVNLAELRKQSNLLEAIERAILDSTGVVVNL